MKKLWLIILGILIVFLGVLPLLEDEELPDVLGNVPSSGTAYQVIIVIVGVLVCL